MMNIFHPYLERKCRLFVKHYTLNFKSNFIFVITMRYIELFLLFVLLPCSFLLDYPAPIKVGLAIACFAYSIFVVVRDKPVKRQVLWSLYTWDFWKMLIVRILVVFIAAYALMYFYKPDTIFVIFEDLKLFILIVLIYSLLSVTVQEFAYRTFFFHRYRELFNNNTIFLITNAFLFGLAHIMFENVVVLLMTFVGGLFFAYTYDKTKSLLVVSIEHAIYGLWLFALGIGDLLAFPMPT